MNRKVVIVEDESLIAYDLELTLTHAGYLIAGVADSVEEALELIHREKPDIVLIDILLKGLLTGIDLGEKLAAGNVAFIYLSANFEEKILDKARTTQPYGFLVKPFRENELLVMMDVILYRHQNSHETRIRKEKSLELSFNEILDGKGDWKDKVQQIAATLQRYVPFDCFSIRPDERSEFLTKGVMVARTGFDKYKLILQEEFLDITGLTTAEIDTIAGGRYVEPGIFNQEDFDKLTQKCKIRRILSNVFQVRSCLQFPIFTPQGKVIHFMFFSRKPDGYSIEHQKLLSLVNHPLSVLTENIIRTRSVAGERKKNSLSKKEASGTKAIPFNGIIGNSHVMLAVFDHIALSGPLEASVLILGESGTGKERVAKSIHQLSPRKNGPLVIINCASLPLHLMESELFGHEKGAFTGAQERRKGKFELAEKGTIFLDEIGEMPVEMQVKLLRVIQEREIERLGGNEVIRIDVRIIAATSRNLEKEVKNGRFRLDLYYRLCVYPIVIPPLRERGPDILLLANHFMERFSEKFDRPITGLTPQARKQLETYDWPGNVRELENSMERSVLLSQGPEITQISIFTYDTDAEGTTVEDKKSHSASIEDNVREHILSVIRKCNGKIGGPGGAAEQLGMPASTLHSKMKKLGVKKWF